MRPPYHQVAESGSSIGRTKSIFSIVHSYRIAIRHALCTNSKFLGICNWTRSSNLWNPFDEADKLNWHFPTSCFRSENPTNWQCRAHCGHLRLAKKNHAKLQSGQVQRNWSLFQVTVTLVQTAGDWLPQRYWFTGISWWREGFTTWNDRIL